MKNNEAMQIVEQMRIKYDKLDKMTITQLFDFYRILSIWQNKLVDFPMEYDSITIIMESVMYRILDLK